MIPPPGFRLLGGDEVINKRDFRGFVAEDFEGQIDRLALHPVRANHIGTTRNNLRSTLIIGPSRFFFRKLDGMAREAIGAGLPMIKRKILPSKPGLCRPLPLP